MNSDSVACGATAAQPPAPDGVPAVVAGIDIGKSWLDAHLEPGGLARRFPNDKPGRRALCKWLRRHGVSRAVFEPTGRYHRQLHQCLAAAGVETVAVRPDCARHFAEALGLLVKTDRVDAKVLARYGRLEGLEATAVLDAALAELQDLVRVRRRYVDECAALARLEQELESKAAVRQVRLQRRALKRSVKALDTELQAAIAADPALRRRAEVLRSIPGVGSATAATLLADMPELGTLGRRAAGALLGVAPCACDSGSSVGRRHVRGGRAEPRSALYMAALTRSAVTRPWPPSTNAFAITASSPNWPSSPSCANSLPSPTPSSARTASGRPPRPAHRCPHEPHPLPGFHGNHP